MYSSGALQGGVADRADGRGGGTRMVSPARDARTEIDRSGLSAKHALAGPDDARTSPAVTRQQRQRIKTLEREFQRKGRAPGKTAALPLSSETNAVISHKGKDQ